jgi:hypothetical protein
MEILRDYEIDDLPVVADFEVLPVDFRILSDDEEYALSSEEKLLYYEQLKAYYQSSEYIVKACGAPKAVRDISNEGLSSLNDTKTQEAFGNRNFFLNYLKSNKPEDVLSKKGVMRRQKINPIIRKALPILIPYKMNRISKAEMPKDRPIIYAPTHGFKDDVACTIATIDDHGYILFGSMPQFYNTIDGVTAWAVGSIIVNRTNPESRKSSHPKMVYAQELGSNLIFFPEGVWNTSMNELMLKIYSGIYDVAKETGGLVAPVATLIDGKTCYSMLDEAFDITEYSREEGIQILRDKMATAQWELMREVAIVNNKEDNLSRKDEIVYARERDNITRSTDKERTWNNYYNSPLGQAVHGKPIDYCNPVVQAWNEHVESLIGQVKCYDRVVESKAPFVDKTVWEPHHVFNTQVNIDNGPVLKKVMGSK